MTGPRPPLASQAWRVAREKKTVVLMIRLYCRANHPGEDPPCSECRQLETYALGKIDRCPLHEAKPICARCTIHCYRGPARESIRSVMRYAGPRMLFHHPWLAMLHLVRALHRLRYTGVGGKHRER